MSYDETFPVYAKKMIRLSAVLAAVGTAIAFYFWGWQGALGVICGAGFQILFLAFLRGKYIKWSEAGREPEAIGTRLVGFTGARLFFEIGACVLFALLFKAAVWGFLIGLLSLTVATLLGKIVDVIKE